MIDLVTARVPEAVRRRVTAMGQRTERHRLLALPAVFAVTALAVGACDEYSGAGGGEIDRTPERLDGGSSQEFEPDDIARAEATSEEIQAYCDGAVSEAQRVGCLSHVDESEIP